MLFPFRYCLGHVFVLFPVTQAMTERRYSPDVAFSMLSYYSFYMLPLIVRYSSLFLSLSLPIIFLHRKSTALYSSNTGV